MPSYPYIDHEWLVNVIIYIIHEHLGYMVLAGLFAFTAVAVPFVIFSLTSFPFAVIPTILMYTVFIGRMGIRVQVIGWLFFAVFLRVMTDKKLYKKGKWILPFIMILWTNIHGSFPLGIVVFMLYVVVNIFQYRKIVLTDILIGFLLLLATFVTPYGIQAWDEVRRQIFAPYIHQYILEWLPFYVLIDVGFFVSAALLGSLFFCYIKKETLWWYVILLFILFVAGLSALRHMPLFVIAGGFLLAQYLRWLFKEAKQPAFYSTLILVVLGAFSLTGLVYLKDATRYKPKAFYPSEALAYIGRNKLQGRIFAPYVWGGYIIWKLPDHKVFIDGRMPSFRFDAPDGESDFVFEDYISLLKGRNLNKLFQRYNVKYIMVQKPAEKKHDAIDMLFVQMGLMLPSQKDASFENALRKVRVRKVYEDKTTVLYFYSQKNRIL